MFFGFQPKYLYLFSDQQTYVLSLSNGLDLNVLWIEAFSLASVDGNLNLTGLKWIPTPNNRQVVHNS